MDSLLDMLDELLHPDPPPTLRKTGQEGQQIVPWQIYRDHHVASVVTTQKIYIACDNNHAL